MILAVGAMTPAAAAAAEPSPGMLATLRGRFEGREVRVVSAAGTRVAPDAQLRRTPCASLDVPPHHP